MKPKKRVSPWLGIALGGMIAAYAGFINKHIGGSLGIQLFIYVGLLMIAIGTGRIIYKWWNERGKQEEEQIAEKIAHVPNDAPRIIYCPRCHAKNYSTSNYCHMCGMKLR